MDKTQKCFERIREVQKKYRFNQETKIVESNDFVEELMSMTKVI